MSFSTTEPRDQDGTFGPDVACTDCGRDFRNRPDEGGALCDECAEERDAHTSALEIRMAKARLQVKALAVPVVVDVALVPVSTAAGVVDVALVVKQSGQVDEMLSFELRRMASAILSADLTTIKDVA